MSFLKGKIEETRSVSDQDIREIFNGLYKNYYKGVDEAYFLNNFRQRDYALLFSIEGQEEIKGFSLQEVIPMSIDGKEIVVIWAGDILIHPDYWGKNDYKLKLSEFCVKILEENPDKFVYRIATPKGYKTYKIVQKLVHQFYISPDNPDYPTLEGKIIDKVLLSKYPPHIYNSHTKMVVPEPEEDAHRLSDGFAQIGAKELEDPYIRFFYEKNPDYARGNEIVTIAPITPENLVHYKHAKAIMQTNTFKSNVTDHQKRYDLWAKDYNKNVHARQYDGLNIIVDLIIKSLRNSEEVPGLADIASLKVMDAGCGTGFVGEKLASKGFTHIDGVDLSHKMVEEAHKIGIYKTLIGWFDIRKEFPFFMHNQYDISVASGVFTLNMVFPESFAHLIQITKPGGLIVIGTRTEWYDTYNFEGYYKKMIKEGYIKLLDVKMNATYLRGEFDAHYWSFVVVNNQIKKQTQ